MVFVGPCAAKKLEAIRSDIRSDVDFVLTFEELQGMFEAKGVDFAAIPEGEAMREGTAAGRGFAVSGGVAGAVADVIHQADPNLEGRGPAGMPQAHDPGPGREVQRLSTGGHGLPRRVRGRRGDPSASRPGFHRGRPVPEGGGPDQSPEQPLSERGPGAGLRKDVSDRAALNG